MAKFGSFRAGVELILLSRAGVGPVASKTNGLVATSRLRRAGKSNFCARNFSKV